MTTLPAQAELLARIRHIWESARTQAARSVNTAHVCANWLIGQQIVEAEQGGAKRAAYGKALLKALSEQLSAEYGAGFSVSALQYMRSFFWATRSFWQNNTRCVLFWMCGRFNTQCVANLRGAMTTVTAMMCSRACSTPACHGHTTAPC